jgi:hypothetical protein
MQRTSVDHDAECEVIYTHAYVHADIPNTNTRVCLARIPTFIPVHNAIVYTMHKRAHFYAFARAGYVLHSLECLERGVVGKCCSNVLRSLRACGLVVKAVRTRVCEKNDTAHVRRSRCAIAYIRPSARSCTPMHTCTPTYQIQTHVYALHVYLPTFIPVHNAIVYTMHKRAPLLRIRASRLCTALT